MEIKNLFPAFILLMLSACVTAYIPFVNEPGYEEIFGEGKKLYPDMFRKASEAEKIGFPSVYISIDETSDSSLDFFYEAANEISLSFSSSGFKTQKEKNNPGLKIKGSILAEMAADDGFGGFIDYQAKCDLMAEDHNGNKISAYNGSVRGLGLTADDAASAALANAGREASKHLIGGIISYYRSKSIVRLEIYNLRTLQELHAFYIKLKAIKDVQNAWLLDYRGTNALFDVSVESGGAGNLARALMETFGTDLKINRPSIMELEAAVQLK